MHLMDKLLTIISTLKPMSPVFEKELAGLLVFQVCSKHDFLLQAGTTSNRIYFIEQGLVRRYYLKDDKEITTDFIRENEFIISPLSFYTQQPSYEFIEAIEDTKLWSLSHRQMAYLYATYPDFNMVGRILTEQYYIRSELRAHYLRHLTAEERYQQFFQNNKDLLNRISGKHVATLLGLTPETYSRMRAKKRKT